MRAPRRLAAFAALSFRSTTAFQSPWIVHRTFRAGIGSTTRAVSVASDVTENTASEQRVWLDSAAADNSIDIYEVTSKSFDMLSYFSIDTFFPIDNLPPPGPSLALRRGLEDMRRQQLRLWLSRYGKDATKPAAILIARRRVDEQFIPDTSTIVDNDEQIGEVVGMVSLSVQTYSDLDQSGLLKPPEFFGKSFLGQALVLLGNSLKDALGSSSAPIDTEVSGQPNSVLQASRDPKSRARSGSDLVPVLANLAVSPSVRRRGLGQRLACACEEIASSWGYLELALIVDNDNISAQKLYTKMGFEVIIDESIPTTKAVIRDDGRLYPYIQTTECAMAKALK